MPEPTDDPIVPTPPEPESNREPDAARPTYAVFYVEPTPDEETPLVLTPTGGTITQEPRELMRKLRVRAVSESEQLTAGATEGEGVRVVLIPLEDLEADPIKGRPTIVLD